MGTKRPIDAVHPSRRDQVPGQSRKRPKPDHLSGRTYKKAHPVNALKSKIRSLSRLLAKDDSLPAHIRVGKERELQTTQDELEQSQTAEQRSKMIAKYHQVRFFDRKKASKKLKRAQKHLAALDDTDESRVEAQHEVDEAEIDVNYAQYYPLDKPYSSLFPKQSDEKEEEDDDTVTDKRKGDAVLRELVKQCMADGRLQDLREGRLTDNPKKKRPPKKQSKRDETTRPADKDEESDGGFFE